MGISGICGMNTSLHAATGKSGNNASVITWRKSLPFFFPICPLPLPSITGGLVCDRQTGRQMDAR